MEEEKVKYIHHTLEEAVFDLVCLAYPHVKMKSLVNNLKKDCDAEIEKHKKEHKAIEIIKEKGIDIGSLVYYIKNSNHALAFYNRGVVNEKKKLTQDEYNLLKEVMK